MDLRLHAPRPDVVVVRVSGPVDGLAARLLADRVGKQLHRAPHVVIDLGGVSVLGSRGVAVLSMLHQQAMARGTQLHVVGAEHAVVRQPLHATGLAQLLSLEATADAAIAVLPCPVSSGVGAGRSGPDPDDEEPACGLGKDYARPIEPSDEHGPRLRAANAISSDPATRQSDGRGASVPRDPRTQRDHTNGAVTACLQQWQDAELAMSVARRCFEGWLQTHRDETPPSMATRHAYHTHEALHQALRAIELLIETFRVEVMARARAAPSCSARTPREYCYPTGAASCRWWPTRPKQSGF